MALYPAKTAQSTEERAWTAAQTLRGLQARLELAYWRGPESFSHVEPTIVELETAIEKLEAEVAKHTVGPEEPETPSGDVGVMVGGEIRKVAFGPELAEVLVTGKLPDDE